MKIFILLIFISLSVFCQKQELNRLYNKLKASRSDTQKINTLNALTKNYIDINNVDSAIVFNKQAVFISSNKTNEKYSYKAFAYKAQLFRKKKELDSALIIANKAFDIAKKTQ